MLGTCILLAGLGDPLALVTQVKVTRAGVDFYQKRHAKISRLVKPYFRRAINWSREHSVNLQLGLTLTPHMGLEKFLNFI